MRVTRWLVIAALASACSAPSATEQTTTEAALVQSEKKTSTDPAVNPDAAALADFKVRVEKYADLHKQLAKGEARPQETADPAKISSTKTALAAKVQAARTDAKQGDMFTPAARPVFRRLVASELKGEDARDTKWPARANLSAYHWLRSPRPSP